MANSKKSKKKWWEKEKLYSNLHKSALNWIQEFFPQPITPPPLLKDSFAWCWLKYGLTVVPGDISLTFRKDLKNVNLGICWKKIPTKIGMQGGCQITFKSSEESRNVWKIDKHKKLRHLRDLLCRRLWIANLSLKDRLGVFRLKNTSRKTSVLRGPPKAFCAKNEIFSRKYIIKEISAKRSSATNPCLLRKL